MTSAVVPAQRGQRSRTGKVAAANVLFLHISSDWIRGSENALLSLLRGLDRNKIRPTLFCGNLALAEIAQANGIETVPEEIPHLNIDGSSTQLRLWRWTKALRRMVEVMKQRDIQLVYCNGGSTCQLGYYAAKIRGVPVICHLHSPYNRRHILSYRFHRATKLIFVSQATERFIRNKQRLIAQTEVVYNGVDTNRFRPAGVRDLTWRNRLAVPEDAIVFGQVSSLIARKGIDILLRAFRLVSQQHPQARLLLLGGGSQQAEYVELAKQLGIPNRVVFAGEHSDPVPFYQHVIDVNVLASRFEALPLSLLEGSACALPNIGARVDGIPEALLDGETGLLFEPEDHTMLADRMSLLAGEPKLRRRFGEAARQLMLQRFSMEKYCQSVERIILEEIASSGRAADVLKENPVTS